MTFLAATAAKKYPLKQQRVSKNWNENNKIK